MTSIGNPIRVIPLASTRWGSGLRTGWGYWLPLTALGSILLLGIGALGGNLYEIPNPTDNEYARMWEEFGADLERK